MVTAGGPHYGPLLEMDSAEVREALSDHVVVGLEVARHAAGKMRPGGTLMLMGGTGGRRISRGSRGSPPRPRPRSLLHRGPRARARAGPRKPDRRRLRRHPAVGLAARRRTRRPAGGAAEDAADRARRRAGRRRRARRSHHDQHRPHRRDIRHRRRPAVRLIDSSERRSRWSEKRSGSSTTSGRSSARPFVSNGAILSGLR